MTFCSKIKCSDNSIRILSPENALGCNADLVIVLGLGNDDQTYNINADTVAGAISSSLNAKRMLMLTDVPGVLDKNGKLKIDAIKSACVVNANKLTGSDFLIIIAPNE